MLTYFCEPRPWTNIIVTIAHIAKAFYLHFILYRAIIMKWKRELITNGLNIISMKMENLVLLEIMYFLPCTLRKLTEDFGLQDTKWWYPYYINTEENIDYVGPMPDISYYCVNEMCGGEGKEFIASYETQVWIIRLQILFRAYCQVDVTVQRNTCRVFRLEFLQIGNIDVFLESLTIASTCNKVLRRMFLNPNTIGHIRTVV